MGSRMTPTLFCIFFLCLSLSRHEFDSEQIPDLTRDVFRQDIHSVGSLCKLYFRELPNPLLTYQLYDRFSVSTGALNLGHGVLVKHCQEKKVCDEFQLLREQKKRKDRRNHFNISAHFEELLKTGSLNHTELSRNRRGCAC